MAFKTMQILLRKLLSFRFGEVWGAGGVIIRRKLETKMQKIDDDGVTTLAMAMHTAHA